MRTLDIYQREVSQFLAYLDACSIEYPQTLVQLDHQLAEYINVLYQEGESLSRAGWVLSGIKRLYPRCRKELQTSQQWYSNWTRDHAPQRATPITWQIVQGYLRSGCLLVPELVFVGTDYPVELCLLSPNCKSHELTSARYFPGFFFFDCGLTPWLHESVQTLPTICCSF